MVQQSPLEGLNIGSQALPRRWPYCLFSRFPGCIFQLLQTHLLQEAQHQTSGLNPRCATGKGEFWGGQSGRLVTEADATPSLGSRVLVTGPGHGQSPWLCRG